MAFKKYQYRVYSFAGAFLGVLPVAETAEPSFTTKLNNGQGQLRFDVKTQFDDYNETLISHMNIVKLMAIDDDNPLGRLIYTGFMSRFTPFVKKSNQGVEITLLGLVTFLQLAYYKSGSNFTVTRTDKDASVIMQGIIDHFKTIYPMTSSEFPNGLIHYAGGHIDTVGTLLTLSFEDQLWLNAFNLTFDYVPEGWFWRIAPDGNAYLKEKSTTADHIFTIGKEIEELKILRNTEKIKNALQYRSTGDTDFSDATSQTTYGKREAIYSSSEGASVAAIAEYGSKFIDDNKDSKVSATLVISDQYDLETINVGDTCDVFNYKLGADLFILNMQIVSVHYTPTKVTLQLEQDITFGKELKQLIQSV